MNTTSKKITPRQKKIQEVGDFYLRRTKPSLLLQGNWLKAAGFPPLKYAIIENPQPGVLIIRVQDKKTQ